MISRGAHREWAIFGVVGYGVDLADAVTGCGSTGIGAKQKQNKESAYLKLDCFLLVLERCDV